MSRKRRTTYRYTLRVGNKIEYFGITNDPEGRAKQHRRNGMPGKMRVQGPPVTPETALMWEHRKISKYRKRNGPSTLMNRTGLDWRQYRRNEYGEVFGDTA